MRRARADKSVVLLCWVTGSRKRQAPQIPFSLALSKWPRSDSLRGAGRHRQRGSDREGEYPERMAGVLHGAVPVIGV